MPRLMRCLYCGALQDEPQGVKTCVRCGGELGFEVEPPPSGRRSYVQVQMELDQVQAPAGRNVDRHLLVTLRTPAQVPPDEAAPTGTGRPPLNLAAVLDVSGSMRGQKLAQAKEAVREALRRLHDGDVFSLVVFSDEVRCVLEPTVLDGRARRVVESVLREVEAGGMTALCGGLEMGIDKAAGRRQETNLVLLLSDGQANVGETDVELVGQRGYQARQESLIVSTLGVGSDYNEALMAEIATQGGGRFYHVQAAGEIAAYLTGELGEVAALAARDVRLHLTLPPGATLVPFSAAYPAQQSGDAALVQVGDVPSDVELEIPLRLTLPGQPAGSKLSVVGQVTYRSPAGNSLSVSLNRVTVRFVEQKTFSLRDGVVAPVAEQVLKQMRAANVLGVSRAMAKSREAGARQADLERARLREYAALLGEERAEEEEELTDLQFAALDGESVQAKQVLAAAVGLTRSAKTFGK